MWVGINAKLLPYCCQILFRNAPIIRSKIVKLFACLPGGTFFGSIAIWWYAFGFPTFFIKLANITSHYFGFANHMLWVGLFFLTLKIPKIQTTCMVVVILQELELVKTLCLVSLFVPVIIRIFWCCFFHFTV